MQSNSNNNYFLYARKSSESEDKQTASIESQLHELKVLAGGESINIIHTYSEAKSAKAPGREEFNKMIEAIKRGEASGIICWKLDRLARNPIDGGEISWLLQQGIISHIRTIDRSFYPTDNVLMMAVEFGMSNQFIRDLSTNTKRGLRKKAADGHLPTYAPLGYIHDPLAPKGKKYILADPERFHLMQKAFRLIAKGEKSPLEALNLATNKWRLTTKFGNPISQSSWYYQLSNPFYFGRFEFPQGSGEWHTGKHPAMISKKEFDSIQKVLKSNYRSRASYLKHLFNGFVRCGECSASITTEIKHKKLSNGKGEIYILCHCTGRIKPDCSQRSIHQEELEKQFRKILDTFAIPLSFGNWVVNYLKWENEQKHLDHTKILNGHRKRYDSCVEKLNRLIDMRTDDLITKEEFIDRKSALFDEKEKLRELLDDSDSSFSKWIVNAEQTFDFAANAKKNFESDDLEKRRGVLQTLGTFLVLTNGKLECELPPVLKVLQKRPTQTKRLPVLTTVESVSSSNKILWLRGSGSNRRPIG